MNNVFKSLVCTDVHEELLDVVSKQAYLHLYLTILKDLETEKNPLFPSLVYTVKVFSTNAGVRRCSFKLVSRFAKQIRYIHNVIF